MGSYYLREVVGIKDYLEKHELPKYGLRFFFKNNTKEDIASRVELGPRKWLYTPSHQLDRGTLENYLVQRTTELGADVLLDSSVTEVEFEKDKNTVTYKSKGENFSATCRWVADATGRGSLLKRKFGFAKPMEHHTNAVWWRLKGVIDITDWSDNEAWKNYLGVADRFVLGPKRPWLSKIATPRRSSPNS